MESKDSIDIIKSATDDVVLTKSQVNSLRDYLVSLEKSVNDINEYKQKMINSIKKYALIVLPQVDISDLLSGCKQMTVNQLDTLHKGLKAQSEQLFSSGVQLKPAPKNTAQHDNKAFKI